MKYKPKTPAQDRLQAIEKSMLKPIIPNKVSSLPQNQNLLKINSKSINGKSF